MKIIEMIKRNMSLITDVVYNTIAFGLYIFSMHILLMPYLSDALRPEINAEMVFFVVILNIFIAAFGHQLGMVKQLKTLEEKNQEANKDYESILFITNILISVVIFIIFLFFGISPVNSAILTLVIAICNSKNYYLAFYRKERNFKKIGIMNGIFLVNIIIGILLHKMLKIETLYWIPVLLAEGFSTLYAYIDLKMYKKRKLKRTKNIKKTFSQYINLVFGSLIENASAYGDKLLILPVLGKEVMNIYYAGTVLSKIVYLVINPINSVIMAWMTSSEITEKKNFIKKFVFVNIILMGLTFLLNLPLTYVATYILYRQYFEVISSVVVLLSISCALGVGNSIIFNLVLRFTDVKNIKYINIIKLIVFIVAGYFGALWWGMTGFIIGMIMSKAVLWFMYLFLLRKVEEDKR